MRHRIGVNDAAFSLTAAQVCVIPVDVLTLICFSCGLDVPSVKVNNA